MQNTESRQRHGNSKQRREIKKEREREKKENKTPRPVLGFVTCSPFRLTSMTRAVVKSTLRWRRRRRQRWGRRLDGTAFHTIRQKPKRVEQRRVRQKWEIRGEKRGGSTKYRPAIIESLINYASEKGLLSVIVRRREERGRKTNKINKQEKGSKQQQLIQFLWLFLTSLFSSPPSRGVFDPCLSGSVCFKRSGMSMVY